MCFYIINTENRRLIEMKKSKYTVNNIVIILGIAIVTGSIILNKTVGNYKHIEAAEKNAYITNLDNSTVPPTVYVSFNYDEDRQIIGRLPAYNETMKECDWVSIYYNVDFPRQISDKNPHRLDLSLLAAGLVLWIGSLAHVIYKLYRNKKTVLAV